MFTTPKVPVFLQKVGFAGSDEKKTLRMVFYVTPITPKLAEEVSSDVRSQLFHKDKSDKWKPTLVMPSAAFNIGTIPLQIMELYPTADDKLDHLGAMLEGVQISNITAIKLFADDPNFTLVFICEVGLSKLSVELAHKYFKTKLNLTFEEMQKPLFVAGESKCEHCSETAIGHSEWQFLCQKHRDKAKGAFELLVKKKTPAEKAAAAKKDGKAAAAGSDKEEQTSLIDADDDSKDMSHANKPRGGRRAKAK